MAESDAHVQDVSQVDEKMKFQQPTSNGEQLSCSRLSVHRQSGGYSSFSTEPGTTAQTTQKFVELLNKVVIWSYQSSRCAATGADGPDSAWFFGWQQLQFVDKVHQHLFLDAEADTSGTNFFRESTGATH